MVEGAIVMLPFLALVFGLLEGSLLLSTSLATSHVSKAGVRAASALGADPQTDFLVLRAMGREGRALDRADIELIVVYKATSSGAAPSATCQAGTAVAGECNVYVASDLDQPATAFGCLSPSALDGPWCPTSRKTALTASTGGPPDYVGLWIKTRHRMITGLVGKSRELTEHSVQRIEPRRM
jgi:hypothetical protein